jgi:hypothetical protein
VQEIRDVLAQASGTTAYHRYSRLPWFPVITDGVLALAEAAGCFWLLDVIGSYQHRPELDKHFQVWTLTVNLEKQSGVVRGYNDDVLIIAQKILYTDFPLEEIKFYVEGDVLLLPSEH